MILILSHKKYKKSGKEVLPLNILNKLERRFGRFYISNLMLYIVIGTGIVYAFQFLFPDIPLWGFLAFDRGYILHYGQIWRLVSFVFIPEAADPISMLFWLYLYWFIGSSLESYWGSFRFSVYYISGAVFAAIAGMITGYATNHYLNLSLFLAMAILVPNMELRLFFFIPVKMKWLAWIDIAVLLYDFIPVSLIADQIRNRFPSEIFWGYMNSYWSLRILILISMLNIVLFFGGDFYNKIRDKFRYRKVRKNFKRNIKMTTYKDDE